MSRPRLFCLNRCLVVRKGIAEMVADASTHAVMYQVEGTRRYTRYYKTSYEPEHVFLQLSSRIFGSSLLRQKSPLLSKSLTSNSHTNL